MLVFPFGDKAQHWSHDLMIIEDSTFSRTYVFPDENVFNCVELDSLGKLSAFRKYETTESDTAFIYTISPITNTYDTLRTIVFKVELVEEWLVK